ncbi:MAG TPA: MBL fold metallo-hydrolase, partial [Thermoanaerobaculia bacterium]|nr:MBL fold metallo-hydrolase [Thermoanaerobaculia bacterium]
MRQARGFSILGALALLVFAGGPPLAADSSMTRERVVTKLADGVYEIRHQDPLYGWVNGNTTVVVGNREALVVDACSVAWAAREDIAEIRRWTERPVRYLLNTHWHHDHNAGDRDYLDAFPGLAIVAHVETRRMLDATSPHVPAQVLAQAGEARARYQKQLATGKGDDGKPLGPQGRTLAEQQLAALPAIVADAKSWVYQAPTLTFESELVIDLGGREVRIAHLGRGNTGGDAIAYLPKEKILIAGDLVVHPVPYT